MAIKIIEPSVIGGDPVGFLQGEEVYRGVDGDGFFTLGLMYRNGDEVPRDLEQCVTYRVN